MHAQNSISPPLMHPDALQTPPNHVNANNFPTTPFMHDGAPHHTTNFSYPTICTEFSYYTFDA